MGSVAIPASLTDDELVPVRTWQGYIMVSTSLLPPTSAEKMKIYPERGTFNATAPVNVDMEALHDLHRTEQPTAQLPLIPNYWNHEYAYPDGPFANQHYEWATPSTSTLSPPTHSSAKADLQNSIRIPTADVDMTESPRYFPALASPSMYHTYGWDSNYSVDPEADVVALSPVCFSTGTPSNPTTPLLTHLHGPENMQQTQFMYDGQPLPNSTDLELLQQRHIYYNKDDVWQP